MKIDFNKIYHGKCLEVMKHIPDNTIDMIYCDLPFGTTQNKWDIIIPFEPLWDQYKRIIKPNGAIVLHAAEPFASLLRLSNLDWYKYDWVWDKRLGTGFLNAKKQPLRNHEFICVFYKKQCTYNPQKFYKENKRKMKGMYLKPHSSNYGEQRNYISETDDNLCYPLSIISIPQLRGNSKEKLSHATQKPVALAEYLIRTYSNEGDVILDNCIGSGTAAIACINTNRKYIGIEKCLTNYSMAVDRVFHHQNLC